MMVSRVESLIVWHLGIVAIYFNFHKTPLDTRAGDTGSYKSHILHYLRWSPMHSAALASQHDKTFKYFPFFSNTLSSDFNPNYLMSDSGTIIVISIQHHSSDNILLKKLFTAEWNLREWNQILDFVAAWAH